MFLAFGWEREQFVVDPQSRKNMRVLSNDFAHWLEQAVVTKSAIGNDQQGRVTKSC